MRTRAPAKLNLFLHVLRRRSDGYHDLETVFELVDLCDEVQVRLRGDGQIRREPPPSDPLLAALPDEADLTVRAARVLQTASGCPLGADIHVLKRIPAGGGLGGGSSDAAAVLLLLNRLWQLDWPRERLAALGATLGADVPVFVHGRAAFARGRGDEITPLALPSRWYLIVHPGVAVPTAEIFGAAELTRDTPACRIAAVPDGGGRNDCEPVVRQRYPEVAAALDWLAAQGSPGRLTGTGSCVFTVCPSREAAEGLAQRLPPRWQGFVARSLDPA
ncbi:MAG: 4-(cytidine 5'-diphospho)-2-C-methyl-D-erythritol kinase [Steroidobacteraceae bacterium]